MTYHDISLTLSPDLVVWPGDTQIAFERMSEMAAGAKANVTRIALSAHTGTHLDAPLHFIEHGEDVTTLALETLFSETPSRSTTSFLVCLEIAITRRARLQESHVNRER